MKYINLIIGKTIDLGITILKNKWFLISMIILFSYVLYRDYSLFIEYSELNADREYLQSLTTSINAAFIIIGMCFLGLMIKCLINKT